MTEGIEEVMVKDGGVEAGVQESIVEEELEVSSKNVVLAMKLQEIRYGTS